jgi:hypothetical protein|nr:MAG TPA: hypothetical protein [Caudoviricetes sp.]
MIKLESDLNKYLKQIYKSTNLKDKIYNSELPLKYDFNKYIVGIYFELSTSEDARYKNVESLDVHFYAEKKISLFEIVEIFDKELNKKDIDRYWFTHKPVYLIKLKEDGLRHWILSYNVNRY